MRSGTGLTHLGSATGRNSMHSASEEEMTDSLRMFHWGLEQGKPPAGSIGIAPEWFFKGNGRSLRAHCDPLIRPPYAEGGGEEAEIAGCYIIGDDTNVYRIGLSVANEFSDHTFEKKNYLNLAGSKLRNSALGPELIINPDFRSVHGRVAVRRRSVEIWSSKLLSGEDEMSHNLANIEHHHFKFDVNRRPGDVHVHFLGASALSVADGIKLESGDLMDIHFEGFGRPLVNPLETAMSLGREPIRSGAASLICTVE